MIKGLYTAYTGMVNEQKRLDVLTNNLANADTNGYKKEGTTSQTFADELAIKIKDTSSYGLNKKLGVISMGVHLGETYTLEGMSVVPDKSFFRPELIVVDVPYSPLETTMRKICRSSI
mgnify:CR=1 FL=1